MDADPALPGTGAPAHAGLPVAPGPRAMASVGGTTAVVPALVAAGGERAQHRFLEFFAATIRNPNTRAAYHRAAVGFFSWCERHGVGELARIAPLHVAAWVE